MRVLFLSFCLCFTAGVFAQDGGKVEIATKSEVKTESNITIKASPVYGTFIVEFKDIGKTKVIDIAVFDMKGNNVHSDQIETNGSNLQRFDFKNLEAGDYFLKMTTLEGETTHKITLK